MHRPNLPPSFSRLASAFATILRPFGAEPAVAKADVVESRRSAGGGFGLAQDSRNGAYELIFDHCSEFPAGLRVVFFPHSPEGTDQRWVWVLGGLDLSEEFDDIRKTIYVGRSLIVQERATE